MMLFSGTVQYGRIFFVVVEVKDGQKISVGISTGTSHITMDIRFNWNHSPGWERSRIAWANRYILLEFSLKNYIRRMAEFFDSIKRFDKYMILAVKMGTYILHNEFWHSCKDVKEKESVHCFLSESPVLTGKRQRTLGTHLNDVR